MIYVIIALFIIMLSFPLLTAYLYYKNRKSDVLSINQNYVKEPRYFAKSFSGMVEKCLPTAENKVISLSREERYLDSEDVANRTGYIEELVLCKKELKVNKGTKEFLKEVYCGENSIFDVEKLIVRAAYGKSRLIIGNYTSVVRWIDAEDSLVVYDNCKLGISATAGNTLCIGGKCSFQRLYAPKIFLGFRPEEIKEFSESKDANIYLMSVNPQKKNDIRYVSKEITDENGVCDFSVRSWNNITVNENLILKGDIRSHKGVRICRNSVVVGNIFCENDVLLEEGALVLGNILCQRNIIFEEGAIVGVNGQISSVIARDRIIFKGKNVVYGFVSCERGGEIVGNKLAKCSAEAYRYLENIEEKKDIVFKSLEDYSAVAFKGFRKNATVVSITIPEGAEKVTKSLCYNCGSLETVNLPKSLKVIEAYAFAECDRIVNLTDLYETNLTNIGTSAFENDKEIQGLHFPNSLKTLGPAAFAGCTGLETVEFDDSANIEALEDHCFKGCTNLTYIRLPDSVSRIGISCFEGCSELQAISIPRRLEEQPGIAGLKTLLPGLSIELR